MTTLGGSNQNPMVSRRVIILGSTGSIGTSTLDVLRHFRASRFASLELVGLATGSNAQVLAKQAAEFNVDHVAIANPDSAGALNGINHVYAGADAAVELIDAVARPGDVVVAAVVGSAGIPAVLAAIERGCDIALANKETLVAAGELVLAALAESDVSIHPVDSEHSAIAQCLRAGRSTQEVKRLVLTASGGPFRTWTSDRIQNATVKEALNHPTWSMGPKITVDSASLMNKALEVIEAHWLFDLDGDQIDVIIHPQSTVHSFVEFIDGSVIAQLGPPDMKGPIQYALTGPTRLPGSSETLDWTTLSSMEFEQVDLNRFPAMELAYEVIEQGGTSGAILNGANEAAVEAFLAEKIPFGRIAELVGGAMASLPIQPVRKLSDILDADRASRLYVHERLASRGDVADQPATTIADA